MSEPLKPYDGPDGGEANDAPKAGYLLAAGLVCGLIIAIGSQALEGHFARRPELAAADPLMARLLVWARWLGWALAGGSAALWAWALARGPQKG
jgi:hypothetical protein